MSTLLHIDASVRGERSLSRRLSRSFVDRWVAIRPADTVLRRDLAAHAPPYIDEDWIAAAFTAPESRTPPMRAALAASDELIDELAAADVVVIGAPMFNYGMPARLKAWVDQVIRVNRTFTFDLARGDYPLEPVYSGKAMALLTSCGEFGFGAGGDREAMNHFDTHLRTACPYLGIARTFHIGIEYQEFGDDRHARSVAAATAGVESLVEQVDIFVRSRAAPPA